MKNLTFLFILPFILLTACGQSTGSSQPRPLSTDAVLDYQRYCHYWMWEHSMELNEQTNSCLSTHPDDPDHCYDIAQNRRDEIEDEWFTCLDDLPMVSSDCRMQLDHADPQHDTDGDGISDYMESWMSLNPCEPCSYGGVKGVDCDADLDFDGDGKPNGEDSSPACGGDEGEFQNCLF